MYPPEAVWNCAVVHDHPYAVLGPVSTLKESPEMFNIYDLKFGREAEGRIQVSVSFRPLQDRYAITVAAQGRP